MRRASSTGASLCHKSAAPRQQASAHTPQVASAHSRRLTCHRSQRREHRERSASKREQRIRPERSCVHAPEGVLAREKRRRSGGGGGSRRAHQRRSAASGGVQGVSRCTGTRHVNGARGRQRQRLHASGRPRPRHVASVSSPSCAYVGAHACVAGAAVPWQRRAAPRRRALQRRGCAARAAVRGSACAGWPRLPAARVRRCSLLAPARDAPGGAGGAGVGGGQAAGARRGAEHHQGVWWLGRDAACARC